MRTISIALFALLTAAPLDAQRLAESRVGLARPDSAAAAVPGYAQVPEPASDVMMVGSAIAAGAAGLLVGGAVGAKLERCGPDEWFCGLAGALIGGTVGVTVGIPIGVQAVGRQGHLGKKVGTSTLIVLGGLALAPVTSGISLLAVPPLQVVFSVREEKRAESRRSGGGSR
jgi:hypothetical protein